MTDLPAKKQPPRNTPLPDADKPTIITDLANGNGPTSNQPTQLSDLSGGKSVSGESMLTKVMAANVPVVNDQTRATELHVATGGNKSGKVSSGTHHHQIWGDFELGDLLGRGGMGSVYRGRQISLDRAVAVKVLPSHLSENDNFRNRFLLEARAVAKISSPHVIGVYFAGVHDGHHYFAMEYVEGQDLSVKLRGGYKPTHRESLELVTQAVRGLSAAGDLGIVHRDIKPANMMVTKKGLLKIMDFGLVRLARSDETGLTMAGTVMGTVSYFSPEQGRGERCDCRTDIYALGVVFYELLTGRLPFTGGDATSVIYQHIHAEPKPPKEIDPTIPETYQAVVLKCLQKNPDHRYADANALLADFTALANGLEPITAFRDLKAIRDGGTIVKKAGAFSAEKKAGSGLIVTAALVLLAGGGITAFLAFDPLGYKKESPTATNPVSPINIPVAITAPVPTQVPAQVPQPAAPNITEARALLTAGSFNDCRILISKGQLASPDDAQWKVLGKELDQAQGVVALSQANDAMAKGDDTSARAALSIAATYLGDDQRVIEVRKRLDAQTTVLKERSRIIAEVESLLSEGDGKKAESLVSPLVAADATDETAAMLLRRARKMGDDQAARTKAVGERIQQGEEALGRKDLDSALLHFTAAQQLDPKNARATAGLEQVTQGKVMLTALREQFEASLKKRDLTGAEANLAEMRRIAPGSSTLVLAENEFINSRLVEENKSKTLAAQQAAIAAAAANLGKLMGDPKQDVPGLERALAAFVMQHGEESARKAGLPVQLEDRRQQEAVTAQLKTLDQALQSKDSKRITSVVSDKDYSSALNQLSVMAGLVFESKLHSFARTGDQATATVGIRHALTTFPERTLTFVYTLARQGDLWTITQATLQ